MVHSSAHDKRRQKRIDRLLAAQRKKLEGIVKQASTPFSCRADAEAAAEKLKARGSLYHRIEVDTRGSARYPRGRPVGGAERIPERYEYIIKAIIHEDPRKVEPLRTEAGCFVLLTNMAGEEETWPARELVSLYKDQNGIEKNFGLLKDPVIVNSLFLKKAERIWGPRSRPPGCAAHLAFDGTRHAAIPRRDQGHHHRLGSQTNEEADLLHDDHQVHQRASREGRERTITRTAAHAGPA